MGQRQINIGPTTRVCRVKRLLPTQNYIHPPPANTTRWTNADLMLGQRRRRWTNIKTALVQRLVFAGPTQRKTFTKCWSSVGYGGPTISRHWVIVCCVHSELVIIITMWRLQKYPKHCLNIMAYATNGNTMTSLEVTPRAVMTSSAGGHSLLVQRLITRRLCPAGDFAYVASSHTL